MLEYLMEIEGVRLFVAYEALALSLSALCDKTLGRRFAISRNLVNFSAIIIGFAVMAYCDSREPNYLKPLTNSTGWELRNFMNMVYIATCIDFYRLIMSGVNQNNISID